jgi:hypothetical protein
VTILATVEAPLVAARTTATVTAAATLLAPADSNRPTTKLMTIEIRDGLLSMLFLIEVDETETTLSMLSTRQKSYLP